MTHTEIEKIIFEEGSSLVEWFGNARLAGGRLLTQEEAALLGISMSIIFVHTVNDRVVNHLSQSDYYVIAGSGYFHKGADGHIETIPVHAGSVVSIPQDTPYWDVPREEGLLMVSINHPPYDPHAVDRLAK
jgi:mannose-6-phosphate isomerase-like protein (cupin superfamily)